MVYLRRVFDREARKRRGCDWPPAHLACGPVRRRVIYTASGVPATKFSYPHEQKEYPSPALHLARVPGYNLKMDHAEPIAQAARAIATADAMLIGAGAGMGVDSGLPDFRGTQGF